MQIEKPMLAATIPIDKDGNIDFDIRFPVLATPKIDGIRCLVVNGQALTRSFKLIPNRHVYTIISKNCPNGFDGEIVVGESFNKTSSGVMSFSGNPNFEYMVFDWYSIHSYSSNVDDLMNYQLSYIKPEWVTFLIPEQINNMKELLVYEKKMLTQGYEGVMLRKPNSPYKFGRSTLNQFYLVKLVRNYESEAKVIAFEELMHNTNTQEKDNFGNSKRCSKKSGMVGMNTLGSLVVRDVKTNIEFKIGTGFDAKQRKEIWDSNKKYISKICTYKYKPYGVKNAPRAPVFKGWRKDI